MKIKIFMVMVVILLLVGINQAQTDEAWHLEEHCLTQPEIPPDDWTYSGTILVSSEQGIHGYNADWDTRRILAYEPANSIWLLHNPISPDGRTWITTQGNTECLGSCDSVILFINQMTVHDLSGSLLQSYNLNWEIWTYDNWKEPLEEQGIPVLRWLSPTQFLYAKDLDSLGGGVAVLFDTISREILPYNYTGRDFPFHRISPDGTLEVRTELDENYDTYFNIVDIQTNTIITTLPENLYPLHYSVLEAWSPDSQFFLASYHSDTFSDIWLVNREGQMVGSIVRLQHSWLPIDVDWSPDSRYLTIFNYNSFGPNPERPISLLVNIQDKYVYDLCLSLNIVWRTAWSYDSTQLALQTSDGNGNPGNITIFEPATWDWHIAEENSDTWLVGWQFPEE